MYYKIADCFVKYEPNYMYMQKKKNHMKSGFMEKVKIHVYI